MTPRPLARNSANVFVGLYQSRNCESIGVLISRFANR